MENTVENLGNLPSPNEGQAETNNTPVRKIATPVSPNKTTGVTPARLRYIMVGVLVLAVLAGSLTAFVRQNSVKPPPPATADQDCDKVTENRLRQALKQNNQDFSAQMDWGAYNMRCLKDYTSAISAFELAVAIGKQSPDKVAKVDMLDADTSLGLAYLYAQREKQAEQAFRDVLLEEPDNALALFGLGSALYLSDPQQALTYLEQVLQLAPNTEAAKVAQQLVDDIKSGKAKGKVLATPTARP